MGGSGVLRVRGVVETIGSGYGLSRIPGQDHSGVGGVVRPEIGLRF